MVASLDDLASRVEAGQPLSDEDLGVLESTRDIIALGMLATTVRRRLRGGDATYIRVADLKIDAAGKLSPEAVPAGAGEARIFQTPKTLGEAVAVVERARDVAGEAPLSAFCLFELSKLPEKLPVVLAALAKAGLTLLTQAPIDKLRQPERALEAVTDAGLRLTRLTVDETPGRRWTEVCREIARLQTSLQSIRTFAPLARKIDDAQPTTGYADVRRVAIARVVVDNVETIQVDWELYGPKLAQVALTFGADDIDSVSAEDDQSQGRRRAPVEEIRRSIQAAGFAPIERDAWHGRRD